MNIDTFPCTYSLEKPSRAELQEILSKIKTKIATLESIITFYQTNNAKLNGWGKKLEDRKTAQSTRRNNTLTSYLDKELECTVHTMGVDTGTQDSCEAMSRLSQNVTSYLSNEADATASVGDYTWANKAEYVKSLKAEKEELEKQERLVQATLGKVNPLIGGILNSDPITIASIIDSHKDDKWLQFQFDSEEFKQDTSYSSSHTSIAASARVGGWFFSAGYSYSHSRSRSTFQDAMSKATLKAKGKLLRVHIKRPWFKPEIFDDRNLDFVSVINSYTCYDYDLMYLFYNLGLKYRWWGYNSRCTWKDFK